MSEDEGTAEKYEEQHVHTVYEQIADHFSSTRHKPWPIVERFLLDLTDGAVGADVGCGNGKYLAVNPNVYIIGSDRSSNLVAIAKKHSRHDAIIADALQTPYRMSNLDFVISIAVIHHLSTPSRRIDATREILEQLHPQHGQALIYVWALEQGDSRRGWTDGDSQDVMVPWVRKSSAPAKQKNGQNNQSDNRQAAEETFQRYYHLYRKGELENDVQQAGGKIIKAGYEKDNWWAIVSR